MPDLICSGCDETMPGKYLMAHENKLYCPSCCRIRFIPNAENTHANLVHRWMRRCMGMASPVSLAEEIAFAVEAAFREGRESVAFPLPKRKESG
jgi:hypothetical protein